MVLAKRFHALLLSRTWRKQYHKAWGVKQQASAIPTTPEVHPLRRICASFALAARPADAAKPSRDLVGPETVGRLGQRYLFRQLGCERFKNIAEPTAVYRLLESL